MSVNSMPATGVRISPYRRRLHLGDALRELREEQNLSITQAAKVIGMDRTLLNRIETSQRRSAPDSVMSIVEKLGVEQHSSRWQDLYALARDAAQTGWWETRAFKGLSPRQALPADLEAGASRIRWYELNLIPGLLQSPAYMRARHDVAVTADRSMDSPVEIRARERRQQQVFVSDGPRVEAIVEETVIRRLMVPEAAMIEQLDHLLNLIDSNPQVDFRIMPVGGKLLKVRAPRSPWEIYEFAAGDPPLVMVESLTNDELLSDRGEVEAHERLWEGLHQIALPPDKSRDMVAQSAETLKRSSEQ